MNYEFKGTKGEWQVTDLDDTFVEKVDRTKGAEDNLICVSKGNGIYGPHEQRLANSYLIAASPELLEALLESNGMLNGLYDFVRDKIDLGQLDIIAMRTQANIKAVHKALNIK